MITTGYLISGSSSTFCHYFEVIYKHVVVIRFSFIYVYHRFKSMKCIVEAKLDHYNMLVAPSLKIFSIRSHSW